MTIYPMHLNKLTRMPPCTVSQTSLKSELCSSASHEPKLTLKRLSMDEQASQALVP